MVERQSCKLKVRSSILREGNDVIFSTRLLKRRRLKVGLQNPFESVVGFARHFHHFFFVESEMANLMHRLQSIDESVLLSVHPFPPSCNVSSML